MEKNLANVDPDAIDKALLQLKSLVIKVQDFDTRVGTEFDKLSLTFRDSAYDRFRPQLETTRKILKEFEHTVEVMFPLMEKNAQLIRTAQNLKVKNR